MQGVRIYIDTRTPCTLSTDTLLLATWNIREFGDNRSRESLYYLAEIISRFDLIAIQEVSASLKGLHDLVSLLNLNWDYFVTDSTDGSAGGGERMAFLYFYMTKAKFPSKRWRAKGTKLFRYAFLFRQLILVLFISRVSGQKNRTAII